MMTARGSLELCYDEFNRAYRTPLFCFTNPDNLIDMNSPPKIISKGLDFLKSCSQSTFCPQPINLKLRINPGDFNLRILMSTSDSISDLKHFIYEQSVKVRTFVRCRNVFSCATLCLILSVMLRTSYSCCLISYLNKLCIDVFPCSDQSNSIYSRTSTGWSQYGPADTGRAATENTLYGQGTARLTGQLTIRILQLHLTLFCCSFDFFVCSDSFY